MSTAPPSPWSIAQTVRQSPPIDLTKPYDPSTLRDKTVLITGGANGLGAHMARRWASHGAHIIIGDTDSRSGEALVAQLRALHPPPSAFAHVPCDVTSWDDQTALFDAAVRLSPNHRIDVVVPNAGVIRPRDGHAFENPSLVRGKLPPPSTATIDVNITGVMYTVHLALHHFSRQQDRGSPGTAAATTTNCLLLIGSIASVAPLAGQAHYTMTKHAVCGLFRSLRTTSFAQRGRLRVNMLAPYFVEQSRMLPLVADVAFLAGTAGGATIPDVVDAATRLVADESISGRSLAVGPPLRDAPDGEIPVAEHEGGGRGRAAWEMYAHDYREVDAFTFRYVHMMNRVTQLRGLVALFLDVVSKILRALTRRGTVTGEPGQQGKRNETRPEDEHAKQPVR
ncbi:NAD(P)-binding domain protein [Metarhizium album ARSEF 1941]|uniref:Hydroxynaphthalene reductase-like protein Arp2 n=1 Tax=Metarhizium album (strain ARSEF 1941) TaxID=1081103 RepID=A0A0B2WXF3_METAS|nr:NAD(P)-binding domain protein [Metarhizium album ARSEF 1941]KHN98718.1 NAD(P)-binding domain protein [Metarhizium album ARSEF 1941]